MRKINLIIFIIAMGTFTVAQGMGTFTVATAATVASDESSSQTIYINTAEDLYQFSKDCTFDLFSKGINVILENDIDLKGEAFTPIPIFSGTFDGNGHTLRGLSIKVEGSNQGFFRYLQNGGTIKNLSIEGAVTPGGEKGNIGGIVGHNSGIVENCSFSGYLKGKDTVGGVVGWNGNTGIIINSLSSGIIYGERKAGGIAGYNTGTILQCTNNSGVNTTVEEFKLDYEEILMDTIDISKLSKLSPDVTDIGGIAGVNTGIVQNSQNKGIIGYPHVGYNVGGIAGRQNGYISNCQNYGDIYGRKEVGGIAGQMEPHISVLLEPSKLKRLHKELNTLQTYITKMINDTKFTSNEMTQQLSSIQGDIDNGKTHAQNLFDITEKLINKDVEEINTISVTAVEAMDKLLPITEVLEKTAGIMEKSISPLQKSLRYLIRAMNDIVELTEGYDELSSIMNYSISKIKEAEGNVKDSNSNIKDALELLKQGKTEGVLELLKSSWDNLKKAKDNVKQAINSLKAIEGSLSDMIDSMGDMGGNMGSALKYMSDAIELLKTAMDDMDEILNGTSKLLNYLANLPPLEFATTDEEYQKTKEDLFDSMGDMSKSFSEFINTMNVQGNIIMDDMQKLSDQLFLVMNLTFNMVDELINQEINTENIAENVVEDVSREDIDKKTEGKISDCKNYGAIEGDINVGGIAGGMSIEIKYDPEEDSNLMGNTTLNTVFQTSAVIKNCENNGKITAKKNHAGGIAGNMDLGYIQDCIGAGNVESTDGNYVGGITGKSYGPVVSSYAKCTLSGSNYIGGISGFAKEIINCYTLVEADRFKACVGAIAGNIDKDSNIKNNFFVSNALAGIDGISYKDKAEPTTYNNLISLENLPPIFRKLQVIFRADDKIIQTLNFDYGDSLYQTDLPAIPQKDGYYGTWDGIDIANITVDTTIEAKYFSFLSVLESMEKRNETLPLILIEGKFTGEDSLTLMTNDEPFSMPKNTAKLEQWSVIIPEDGNPSHTVRYLPPNKNKNLDVYVLKDGNWTKVHNKWDGKYLIFETAGNNITFSIAENEVPYQEYAILTVLISVAFLFVIGAKKKRKQSNTLA